MFWEIVPLGMGACVILIGCLVIRLYFGLGRRIFTKQYHDRPEVWFAHGIAVAFASTVINTIFFKLFLAMALKGWYQRPPAWMNGYVNFVCLGMMMWAAFCHLYSAYLNLNETEKSEWNWLTIAFYPDRNPVVRLVHHVIGLNKKEKDKDE
jgi:magnesium-transporting ATPase (P-type)